MVAGSCVKCVEVNHWVEAKPDALLTMTPNSAGMLMWMFYWASQQILSTLHTYRPQNLNYMLEMLFSNMQCFKTSVISGYLYYWVLKHILDTFSYISIVRFWTFVNRKDIWYSNLKYSNGYLFQSYPQFNREKYIYVSNKLCSYYTTACNGAFYVLFMLNIIQW